MDSSDHLTAVRRQFVRWAGALGLMATLLPQLDGQAAVSGTVTDRNGNPVPEAAVALEHRDLMGLRLAARSDEHGAFNLATRQVGSFLLDVDHPGFFPIVDRPVDLVAGPNVVKIELTRLRDGGTSLDIHADAELAAEDITLSQSLSETEIDSIPMARSTKQRIQGVVAIMPGVLRDPMGGLHVNGSGVEETNWTLDGFTASDPASGRLEMALGAESVKSMDLFSGRYSAALGKGTGGAMALNTRTGEDTFRHAFTNFVPGMEIEEGLRLRDWRPRHSVSGPVVGNRVWFFNGLDALYEENFVPELPDGEDRNRSLSVNDSLRLHARLTPRQTLSAGLVADYRHAPNSGLSPLDPMETTLDRRARRYLFNVKDQILLSPESVLDFGYAAYRSTYRGEPQGRAPFRITSQGRAGNYPVATYLATSRDELRANLFVPWNWLGQHQLQAGANLGHTRYLQDVRRSPIEYFRVDGTQASELSFVGSGAFGASNIELGTYLQDRWAVHPRLVAELGLRWDRDLVVSGGALTPRFSVAFRPPWHNGTRLAAGLGWIPAATYLRAFTRHLDQASIFTRFGPDGVAPARPPELRLFHLDRSALAIPSARSLSAGWVQSLPGRADLSVNYLRKRTGNGYTQVPVSVGVLQDASLPQGTREVRFQLLNFRQDSYDSVELSLSKPLLGSHRWFASYTYSRSWSNAAAEVDTDDTILFSKTAGRLSWDVPHRLVSWATFPVGEKTSIGCFVEWRDGFPFSLHDDNGKQVGPVNGSRLPRHFSINVHVERRLSFLGHRWSLRPGLDNVTNRPNYRFANANTASPEFLHLFGRSPIKLIVRVRWLGKAAP